MSRETPRPTINPASPFNDTPSYDRRRQPAHAHSPEHEVAIPEATAVPTVRPPFRGHGPISGRVPAVAGAHARFRHVSLHGRYGFGPRSLRARWPDRHRCHDAVRLAPGERRPRNSSSAGVKSRHRSRRARTAAISAVLMTMSSHVVHTAQSGRFGCSQNRRRAAFSRPMPAVPVKKAFVATWAVTRCLPDTATAARYEHLFVTAHCHRRDHA